MSFLMLEAERWFEKSSLNIVEELVDWKEVRRIVGKLDRSSYGLRDMQYQSL